MSKPQFETIMVLEKALLFAEVCMCCKLPKREMKEIAEYSGLSRETLRHYLANYDETVKLIQDAKSRRRSRKEKLDTTRVDKLVTSNDINSRDGGAEKIKGNETGVRNNGASDRRRATGGDKESGGARVQKPGRVYAGVCDRGAGK